MCLISLLAICISCLWNGCSCPFSVEILAYWFVWAIYRSRIHFFHICRKCFAQFIVYLLASIWHFFLLLLLNFFFLFQVSCVYRKAIDFLYLCNLVPIELFLALRVFSWFSLGFFSVYSNIYKQKAGLRAARRTGGGMFSSPW